MDPSTPPYDLVETRLISNGFHEPKAFDAAARFQPTSRPSSGSETENTLDSAEEDVRPPSRYSFSDRSGSSAPPGPSRERGRSTDSLFIWRCTQAERRVTSGRPTCGQIGRWHRQAFTRLHRPHEGRSAAPRQVGITFPGLMEGSRSVPECPPIGTTSAGLHPLQILRIGPRRSHWFAEGPLTACARPTGRFSATFKPTSSLL